VFGNVPPILAGRERLIDDVLRVLDNAPGDPNRITIFTGPRGSGKTVLLNKIAEDVEGSGWIAVHTVASLGMLSDIKDQFERKAVEFLPKKAISKITGIQVSGIGITRETLAVEEPGWRTQIDGYLDVLAKYNVGLLITVDEISTSIDEFISFISVFQFFIRDKRNIALLMAGLSNEVMQMYQEKSISFIRRAFMRKLKPIGLAEVRAAIKKTVELTGRTIETAALKKAAESTVGFAFLIQLVGYHAFNQSQRKAIATSDVDAAIIDAREDMEYMIVDASLKDLSDTDKKFLVAMLVDEEDSRVADIAKRLGSSSSTVSHYKRRLINQGILHEVGRGKVAFSMPMLKTLMIEKQKEILV